MKYLKGYKLFESHTKNTNAELKEYEEYISDILSPLRDTGEYSLEFNTLRFGHGFKSVRDEIIVRITNPGIFNSDIFKDEFSHLFSYLSEIGFIINISAYVYDGPRTYAERSVNQDELLSGLECYEIKFKFTLY